MGMFRYRRARECLPVVLLGEVRWKRASGGRSSRPTDFRRFRPVTAPLTFLFVCCIRFDNGFCLSFLSFVDTRVSREKGTVRGNSLSSGGGGTSRWGEGDVDRSKIGR